MKKLTYRRMTESEIVAMDAVFDALKKQCARSYGKYELITWVLDLPASGKLIEITVKYWDNLYKTDISYTIPYLLD